MKKRRKTKQKCKKEREETVEINPETGQVMGWCTVLKDLGMLSCDLKCDTCLCG